MSIPVLVFVRTSGLFRYRYKILFISFMVYRIASILTNIIFIGMVMGTYMMVFGQQRSQKLFSIVNIAQQKKIKSGKTSLCSTIDK